jgi:lipopolysaccharide export system protein LptA
VIRRLAAALSIACTLALTVPSGASAQSAPTPRPAAQAPGAAAAKPKAPEPKGEPGVRNTPGPVGIDRNSPVTIDADLLENLQKEGLVVFTGNVVANQNSSTHYSDRMEVYLDAKGDGIVRTVSSGNVKIITKDCKIGTAKRAEYYDAEQRVVLVGNARVWQEDNVVTGERITIFLAEDRSVVEGGKQERVKAVFYPRGQEQPAAASKPPGAAPCG